MKNEPKNHKQNGQDPQNNDEENRKAKRIILLVVLALIATLLINTLYTAISTSYLNEITYSEFLSMTYPHLNIHTVSNLPGSPEKPGVSS